MAAFTDPSWEDLDWRILRHSSISLYFSHQLLEQHLAWFQEHDYVIQRFDCTAWDTSSTMLAEFSTRLAFPGLTLSFDGFNDWLSDVEVPDKGGLLLVLDRFDAYADKTISDAQSLLDILDQHSRDHMLYGQRMITIAQSDDPEIAFEPVGARPVLWNDQEWLNEQRGLTWWTD